MQPLASIPSPSDGVWYLGPLPLRAYAAMIILGVIVAVWVGERRWTARGGSRGTVLDVAVWAVPFGLVGGRLYHVVSDNQLYFGEGKHPIDAIKVWNGGLSIWGAIALGALGAYLGCRSRGVSLRAFADAVAPGIVLAQAIGRWGNWFNQELYGRATKLPWAVEIDPAHRPPTTPDIATYHPTFLYESLWCVGVAVFVVWAERRYRLGHGRVFALYVAGYTAGRAWIEWLRVDEAHHFLGMRLNDWTALVVFLAAVAYIYLYWRRGPELVAVAATAEAGADGVSPEAGLAERPMESEAAETTSTAGAGADSQAATGADDPDEAGEPGAEPDAAEPPAGADEDDRAPAGESNDEEGGTGEDGPEPANAEKSEESADSAGSDQPPEPADADGTDASGPADGDAEAADADGSGKRERATAKEGQEAK